MLWTKEQCSLKDLLMGHSSAVYSLKITICQHLLTARTTSQALFIVLQRCFSVSVPRAGLLAVAKPCMCCFKILEWHAQGTLAEMRQAQPPPSLPRLSQQVRGGKMLDVFCVVWQFPFTSHKRRSKHAASYLIFVWFRPSSAAPKLCQGDSIRVNNCELPCYILLVVFDVQDVIKSAFSVSSAVVKSVSLHHAILSVSYWVAS